MELIVSLGEKNKNMKIQEKKLEKMFILAGIKKENLYNALRQMYPEYLKPDLRKDWSEDNPTRNFCYVVSEFLKCFVLVNSSPYSLIVPGDNYKHYFVVDNGNIIDLTAEQFLDYSIIEYQEAKKSHFMNPSPSKRAKKLAKLMKYDID